MATEYKLSYTASEIDRKLGLIDTLNNQVGNIRESIPTKTSELDNDSGYITLNDVPEANVPTKVSELENDAGYLTDADLPDIPNVPTKTSQLENDSGFITTDDLPESGSVTVDPTLSVEGQAADAKATGDRLLGVEYQTVTTEEAYEHKDLPEGEKTVTINSDGSWGDVAYICTGEDLVTDRFNRTFPYDNITITKDNCTYHITGTGGAKVAFVNSEGNGKLTSVKQFAGQKIKLITFAKRGLASNLRVVIQFFDEGEASVSSQHKKPITSSTSTLSAIAEIEVPSNTAYMTMALWTTSGFEFDDDFQIHLSLADTFQVVNNIENTVVEAETIKTLPYPSIVDCKMPLSDYIDYVAESRVVIPDIIIPETSGSVTYLTPEDFGAVGDGKTDDSEAIANCLVKASSKQIVLMAKKYYVTQPIVINSNCNVIANAIIYEGTDTAIRIDGKRNTLKVHSITSAAVGLAFGGGESGVAVIYNNVEVDILTSQSHGITFTPNAVSMWQNTIRFSCITAGGAGCYGIAFLKDENKATTLGENSFYGGQITNCEWAVYKCSGNSKFYGIHVEGKVQGGFYIETGCHIFHPRIAEAQRDGNLPIYKFVNPSHATIYDSSGIYINQIDLSDVEEVDDNKGYPITEYALGTINGRVICSNITDGVDAGAAIIYSTKTYIWGKYLIFTPYMAYKKIITTDRLDTRSVGSETSHSEIAALSQLPTKFVVNNIDTEIYLHSSYCAFGFNEFEVEQANGNTCKVYDVKGTLLFDGAEKGNGLYKFKVYKDATYCADNTAGALRYDFLGHYWQVTKEGISATDDGAGNVTLTTEVVSV